jgi:hypothetical protein
MAGKLDISKVCQNCKKPQDSTMLRTIYTKNYMGPCGDSFCYASCDMSTCHPISVVVCTPCAKELEKKK